MAPSPLFCGGGSHSRLQSEIFLVAQPVGAPLDDTDFIVQSFDKAEGDFVLRQRCRPAISELSEGLFEQIRDVEPLVGGQQQPQVLSSTAGEILQM